MDEKENKSVEEKSTVYQTNHAGQHHNHEALAITLSIIAVLIILAGIAGVAKLTFYHNGHDRFDIQKDIMAEGNQFSGHMGRIMYGDNKYQRSSNSLVAKITKIDGDNLTVYKDSNNKDYTVTISDSTQIRKNGDIAGKSDLVTGQAITVSGRSNSSEQIDARVIIIN